MHFVMHAFSNYVEGLHNATPIDLLAQSAVLSDGVVFCTLTIFMNPNHLAATQLRKPPVIRCPHTNTTAMRHQIYDTGRGGLVCPPKRAASEQSQPLAPLSSWKPRPNDASGYVWAMIVLFQQPHF